MRPRKAPALLEDGEPTLCDHYWVGMNRSATHWLRFDAGPLWFCERCNAYTRRSEVVQASTQWATS
jgi:hypothetical protein